MYDIYGGSTMNLADAAFESKRQVCMMYKSVFNLNQMTF